MTVTRIGLLCEKLIEAGWLAAVVTVPLYFNIYSSRVFEPDKLIALRSIVLLMALAFVVRLFEKGVSFQPLADGQSRVAALWKAIKADNPLAFPTIVLCLTMIVSTIGSVSPAVSFWGSYQRLQGTYSWLTYIALFFLVAHFMRTREQLNRLITVMILTSLPVSLYGLAQAGRLDPLPWGGDVITRVAGSMGNAIFLSAYLIMIVPLTVARLVDAIVRLRTESLPRVGSSLWVVVGFLGLIAFQNVILVLFILNANKYPNLWWGAFGVVAIFLNLAIFVRVRRHTSHTVIAEVIAYGLLTAIQIVAIVLTQSRGPQLGLLAGLFVFALILVLRFSSRQMLTILSAAMGCLVAILIIFNAPNSPIAQYRSIPYLGRFGTLWETESGSGKVRLLIWQGTWELITNPPNVGLEGDPLNSLRPLVGFGPESMYVAFNKVYPPDLAHYEARNASPDRAHQAILDLVVTTGLMGLAAFVFVLVAAFRVAWRMIRRSTTLYYQLAVVGIVSAISSHIVESQVGIPIASTLTHLWVLFGAIVAVGVMHRNEAVPLAANGGATIVEPPPASKLSETARFDAQARTRKKKARPIASGAAQGPIHRRSYGTSPAWQYGAAFVFLSLVATVVLATWPPFQDMWQGYIGGFFWLLLGVVVVAVSLSIVLGRGSWDLSRLWIHAPLVAIAVMAILYNQMVVGADIFYKRGFMFEGQRNWEESIRQYQEALRLAPDQDFYYLFLGRLFLEAAKASNRPPQLPAEKIDADFVKSLNPREMQKMGRDDLLEASRVALQEAQRIAPLNTDHTANLARLYRYWGGLGDGSKIDLSLRYYSDALKLSPQAAHLWDEWAEVDLATGNHDKGIEKLEIARKLDDRFPLTFIYLGDVYLSLNRPEQALEAHSRVLELDPAMLSDQKLEQRMSYYLNAKLADRLVPLYAAAAEKNPNSAAVRSAFGYLLSRLGKIPEASKEFEAWVNASPKDWIARRNLALSYENLGRIDVAIREAEQARSLAPAEQKEPLGQWVNQLNQKKR